MQWDSNIYYFFLAVGAVILVVSIFLKDKSVVNREGIHLLDKKQDETKALIEQADKMLYDLNAYSESIIHEMEVKHKEILFTYQLIDGKNKELQSLYDKIHTVSENKEYGKMKAAEVQPSIPQHENVTEKDLEQLMEKFFMEQHTDAEMNLNQSNKIDINDSNLSKKDKVIYLYNEGNTIEEISNLLHIGKGETQLIIDLSKRGEFLET